MTATINLQELLRYTQWERDLWYAWMPAHPDAFATTLGANGDGRFETVGGVIRHVFSAEQRYVDRLAGRPLTDPAAIPTAFEPVFAFGRSSRKNLVELVASLPTERWDVRERHRILDDDLWLTPRKILVHVLLHEIRHWAQIATVLRQNNMKGGIHDFLFSPCLGGDPRSAV